MKNDTLTGTAPATVQQPTNEQAPGNPVRWKPLPGTGAELKRALGEHLGRYPWDHFLTLTFRRESVADFAVRSWNGYVNRVELAAGIPLVWFYGTEYGKLGRLHIHALTLNTGVLPIARLHREWFQPEGTGARGRTRVHIYNPRLGAAHYVSKYITKDLAEYDISDRLREAQAARGCQRVLPIGPAYTFDALRRNQEHNDYRAARRTNQERKKHHGRERERP